MDLTKRHLVIKPDGTVVKMRMVEEPVGLTKDVLRIYATTFTKTFKNIAKDIHMNVASNDVHPTLAIRMETLPLTGKFRLHSTHEGDVQIRPTRSRDDLGQVEMSMSWVPPYPTFLILKQGAVFLVSVNSARRTIKLPYPNQYDDGKVCMGDSYAAPYGLGLIERLQHAKEHFMNSRFNTDLMSEDTGECFSFTADRNQRLIEEEQVRPYEEVIGASHIDWITEVV